LCDRLDDTMMALGDIKTVAEADTRYDQLLARGNAEGEALIMAAVDALIAQTRWMERAVAELEMAPIAFEGSDSLDNPGAVFQ
jgi:putative iron-regulated protein